MDSKKLAYKRKQRRTGTKKSNSISKTRKTNQRKYELSGVALCALSVITLLGLAGFHVGFVGTFLSDFFCYFFGIGSWLLAIFLFAFGGHVIVHHEGASWKTPKTWGYIGFFLCFLAIYHHFSVIPGKEIMPESLPIGGGLIGGSILFLLRKVLGFSGSIVLLSAVAIGSLLLATTWSLSSSVKKSEKTAKESVLKAKNTLVSAKKSVDGFSLPSFSKREGFYDRTKDARFEPPVDLPDVFDEQEILEEIVPLQTTTPTSKPAPVVDKPPVEEMPAFAPYASQEEAPYTPVLFDQDAPQNYDAYDTPQPFLYTQEATSAQSMDWGATEVAEVASSSDPLYSMETPSPAFTEPIADAPASASCEVIPCQPTKGHKTKGIDDISDYDYRVPSVTEILPQRHKAQNAKLAQEIAQNSKIITQTLDNFRVKASIVNVCHGPAVTRYEVEPAPGVKVSKVTALADDLALALAAFSVRIEPVPGKSVIGIEVPNQKLDGVMLRDVLNDHTFSEAASRLTVGLGMDIGGNRILADLAKMPHLLVAGATGSGKSVCINTLITSILFKARPEEVKFILIDPKMVELSAYNDIPHMMIPVVTDAQKASAALNWSVREMEKRYTKFAATGVRNLEHFNASAEESERMPAIVIIIDELADLMMVASHDVEDAICRLAQKARAAGIHLILATQRPSVNVITGVIKANIPSRISFAVSSRTDSQTILDRAGAEKLLGNGDMLYAPVGVSKPLRVQGAFISDEEIEQLLSYVRSQKKTMEINEELAQFTEQGTAEAPGEEQKPVPDVDKLLRTAVDFTIHAGQISTSALQRRLRIGYSRAARLIDTMEELQIIGPSTGNNKAREVIATPDEVGNILTSLGI